MSLGSWTTGKAWMDTVTMQFCLAVSAQLEANAGHLSANTVDRRCDEEELEAQLLHCKEQLF